LYSTLVTFTVLLFFLSDVFFSKSEEGAADLHAEAAKGINKIFDVTPEDDPQLRSELKKIREKAAAEPLWAGPPLPQLARLATTPIDSRSVSVDQVDIHAKKPVSCNAPNHAPMLYYYFMQADIPGMDVGSEKTATTNECCSKCVQNPKCEAWTHADGTCWLKSGANKMVNNKVGLISGMSVVMYNKNVGNQLEFKEAMRRIEKEPMKAHEELIWPLPESIDNWRGGARPVSKSLALEFDAPGDQISKTIVERAFERAKARILSGADSANATRSVMSVRLQTTPQGDAQNSSDDGYAIELKGDQDTVYLSARTTNGFLMGIETLSQICSRGYCIASSFKIRDRPMYPHRGLLVDVGRRFVPVPTILAILEGMASLKMNAFHFHLNDWVAIRWKSETFPKLNQKKRFYSKADFKIINDFAEQRGIAVYPEIDIPGHAHSFSGLSKDKMLFCDNKEWQLFHDKENKTLSSVKILLKEMLSFFPKAKIVHIGGDETENKGPCNQGNFGHLSKAIQEEVSQVYGRTPVVWNEAYEILNALSKSARTIVQCWSLKCNATRATLNRIPIIYSKYDKFYLDHTSTACNMVDISFQDCMWTDIVEDGVDTKFLLGGETTMWTDEYCPHDKCVGHAPTWGGHIGWLFKRKQDDLFGHNFLSVIFPRAAAAAGSFYRFKKDLPIEAFLRRYFAASDRVEERVKGFIALKGGERATCPLVNCNACTMTHRCDETWESYFAKHGWDGQK
jgi:hypothetical protein